MKKYFLFAVFVFSSFIVSATTKTVTLDVATMNCVTCPYTVKLSLKKVEGVSEAAVDFDSKEAVVTFDDEKTTVDALIQATADAGYPSTLKEDVTTE
jgi:mercuric ion binding protein